MMNYCDKVKFINWFCVRYIMGGVLVQDSIAEQ